MRFNRLHGITVMEYTIVSIKDFFLENGLLDHPGDQMQDIKKKYDSFFFVLGSRLIGFAK